jgi:hypothetical protein
MPVEGMLTTSKKVLTTSKKGCECVLSTLQTGGGVLLKSSSSTMHVHLAEWKQEGIRTCSGADKAWRFGTHHA